MANDSVISIPSVKPRELLQGGTSTTETVFTSDGTIPVILPMPTGGQLGNLTFSPYSSLMTVRAWGRAVTGTTANVTVILYFGTSTTVGSNTAIATTGAVSYASASSAWFLEARLVVNAINNKITGFYWAHSQITAVANTTITAVPTTADPDGGGTLGFVVSGTASSGNAANAIYLDGFQLEL